jgi:RNA polymerase sigma factor (sigma-70 family)
MLKQVAGLGPPTHTRQLAATRNQAAAPAKYRVKKPHPRRQCAKQRQPGDPAPPAVKLRSRRTVPTAAAGGALVTDAQVITQSVDDPERFAVIFDRHADEIHRYAARRLGRQGAGDVVSEVFLAAFRNRGRYQADRTDARPWLYGIATNVISQQLRAEGRRAHLLAAVPAPPPADFPADDIGDRITAERLRPALLGVLAGLSPAERELVLLVAWAELSYEQAAQALEIPVGTVRSRLHRARAKVRRAIDLADATR